MKRKEALQDYRRRTPCSVSLRVRVIWTTLSLAVSGICVFSFLQPYWIEERSSGHSLGMYHYCLSRIEHFSDIEPNIDQYPEEKFSWSQTAIKSKLQNSGYIDTFSTRGDTDQDSLPTSKNRDGLFVSQFVYSATRAKQPHDDISMKNDTNVRNRRSTVTSKQHTAWTKFSSFRENTVCGIYGTYFRLSHLPSNAWQIACVLYGGGCAMLTFGALSAIVTSFLNGTWGQRVACYTGYIQTMAVVTLVGGLLTFPVGFDSKFVRHYCSRAQMYDAGHCHVGWSYILGIMGTALSIFCPYLSQFTNFKDNSRLYDIYI